VSGRRRKVCFFAHGIDRATLERVEFYKQDVDILRGLDVDVHIASGPTEITLDADLYVAWWWTWAFQPALVAAARRKPLLITGVFDLDWAGVPGDFWDRPVWERRLMAWSVKRARSNVLVSKHETNAVAGAFGVSTCTHIPLCVDTNIFRPGTTARDDRVLTVAGMHARNAKRKRIDDIIRAVPRIRAHRPNVRVTIAGERAAGFPEVAALARELGVIDVVDFPGIISREEKLRLMATSKVYLQPSRFEGFGLGILEAMSCGMAVVSNPVGAVPEVVGDAGVLVADKSPDALAEAVVGLLDDDVRRDCLGHRARTRAVEHFHLSRRRRELGSLVNQLLEQ
jgi:glycosyltransferase involved in cell wall biosynthesis